MISKILIENYRSIKRLEFEPRNLCAFIGENNVGKSNILSAIDLLLGERWPANRITIDDVCNRDVSLNVRIQIYFDTPIVHTYYGNDLSVSGFGLGYNFNTGATLQCLNSDGSVVQTQYSRNLPMSNAVREKAPSVYIGVNRDLARELSGSQWTVFGRLLKDIEEEFHQNPQRVTDFNNKMREACNILRISGFTELENTLKEHVKQLTGFINADLKFTEPKVFAQYKLLN